MSKQLTKAKASSSPPIVEEKPSNTLSSAKTSAEIRRQEQEHSRLMFDKASEQIRKLRDVNKIESKFVKKFNKEEVLSYFNNVTSNEKRIREVSWYLFYRSQVYRRVIQYYSSMFCLQCRSVVPKIDFNKKNLNNKKIEKSYYQTLDYLDSGNLSLEFFKAYLNCFIQDVYYGVGYWDETGFFTISLPTDKCAIAGVYKDGSYAFCMDMTYFRNAKGQAILEMWGEPFISMYKAYDEKNEQKMQLVPPEYSICLKFGVEDWQTAIPPLSGSFGDILNLEDTKDNQSIADEQDIYKMLYYKMNTISGSKKVNDWEVDPDFAISYINRLITEAIPDYATMGMLPGGLDLGVVDFSSSDKISDTTKVTKATLEVLNGMGGAQVLNGATITGAEAMRIAQRVDTHYALTPLLPQTQAIVNRLLSYRIKDASTIKFLPVSWYTRDEFRESMMGSLQNGYASNIITYNTLLDISEKSTLSMLHFNNNILRIHDEMIPLQSSYTQSSKGGRPKEDGEATERIDNIN